MAEIDNLRGKGVLFQGKVYKKTGSGEMDLSDRMISSVSEIIGLQELKNLTKLNLSNNNISEIKGLEKLIKLTELNLSYNNITDISGIENLKNLRYLNLSNNSIKDLKGISELSNLTSLNITNNYISNINEIYVLRNLRFLYIKGNDLGEIEEDQFLGSLKLLDLKQTTIKIQRQKEFDPKILRNIGILVAVPLIALLITFLVWVGIYNITKLTGGDVSDLDMFDAPFFWPTFGISLLATPLVAVILWYIGEKLLILDPKYSLYMNLYI